MGRQIRPSALREGSLIAIVTTSFPGPAAFPHRLERGCAALRSLGFRTKLMPHANTRRFHTSGTGEERAQDLMAAFADPEVDAVWCTMGGDHANQILPFLDFDLLRRQAKVFVGYADNTVLHAALGRLCSLVTFHGTAVLTGLGEYPEVLPLTRQEILRALTRREPLGALPAAEAWTDEGRRWDRQEDLSHPRALQPGAGWQAWREGAGAGPLEGGCIASLMHLAGTPYWPRLDGAVLLLETSEHGYPPSKADAHLTDLENLGVLGAIRALLVARAARYTAEEKEDLRRIVLERTATYDFPIVGDVDAGHCDPMLTLPLGCRTRVEVRDGRASIEVLEPGVC